MKKLFVSWIIYSLWAAAPQSRPISDGLEYQHLQTEAPCSIHILRVNPEKIVILPERALNNGIGRETVSSIAARKGAVGGINGGFFRIGGRYDGEATGILKIGTKWYSDPSLPRGAIGWNRAGTEGVIGRLTMKWALLLNEQRLPIDGINRPRDHDEIVLYGWPFHRSTLTDPGGLEISISNGQVMALSTKGDTAIPPNGVVCSIGAGAGRRVGPIPASASARITYDLLPAEEQVRSEPNPWPSKDYIVGGVPVLVHQGKVIEDFGEEQIPASFARRHPRTAVGFRQDGTWIFVVVDGRQPSLSVGMTLTELANLLRDLGCSEALNLDGGGSSTLVLQGNIMNSPSDGRERPVSDAILWSRK
jgi:hypothetical protein